MVATLVLLVATIAFFEALSRSATPRAARLPLGSMSAKDHLAAAWAGLELLHEEWLSSPSYALRRWSTTDAKETP